MAEGARLERVYTGNRIEGSNPSLSAIFYKMTPFPGAGGWTREITQVDKMGYQRSDYLTDGC